MSPSPSRRRAFLAFLAVCLVAVAPAAEAKSKPQLYFLKDVEVSPGHRAPIGDGELSVLPPPPIDLVNPANNTPPSSRVIYPYASAVAPVQFVANASANTGRIRGVITGYLFLPKTPAMQSATLNVSLVVLPKDPAVPPELGGGGKAIAWAKIPLDYQNQTLPNATSWAPQNVTDPRGAVNYTAAQVLSYGITTLYSSGALVFLDDATRDYVVDVEVPADARLGLRMVLENGSAIPPLPGAPVPIGAGQDIVYDFGLAFSLVMVPWYEADPPVTSTSPPPPPPPPTSSSGAAPSSTSSTKGSPDLPFFAVGLAAVAVAWTLRRKL